MRSGDAKRMLESIAVTGAAGGRGFGLFLSDRDAPELLELNEKGYVCKMNLLGHTDHQNFTLTGLGRSSIKPCLQLGDAVGLIQFKGQGLAQNFEDFTTLELILHLSSHGWTDQEQTKTKRTKPYTLTASKIWYKSPFQKPSKLYLHVLAISKDRISKGCSQEIHHFQPQSYYRCIIDNMKGILPNQPLAFYKMLYQNQNDGSGNLAPPTDNIGDATNDAGEEEMGNLFVCLILFCLVSFTFVSDSAPTPSPPPPTKGLRGPDPMERTQTQHEPVDVGDNTGGAEEDAGNTGTQTGDSDFSNVETQVTKWCANTFFIQWSSSTFSFKPKKNTNYGSSTGFTISIWLQNNSNPKD